MKTKEIKLSNKVFWLGFAIAFIILCYMNWGDVIQTGDVILQYIGLLFLVECAIGIIWYCIRIEVTLKKVKDK